MVKKSTHMSLLWYKLPSERAICILSMWQGLKATNSWRPRNEVKRILNSNDVAIGVKYSVASSSSWFQMWCSQGGFSLLTIVILSVPQERDQIIYISKTFPYMNFNHTGSNHWHCLNKTFVIAYRISYHWFSFEIGRQSTISIPIGNIVCLWFYDVVKVEAHFMLGCLLYNSITNRFLLSFHNVVLGNLRSFFQVNRQVDTY